MLRPLCRYCAKPIRKRTVYVVFTLNGSNSDSPGGFWRQRNGRPTSKEEAQRFLNEAILTAKWATDADGKYIHQITAWDGESYTGKYFCGDTCARQFGAMVAEEKPNLATAKYWEAVEKQKLKATKEPPK